MGKFVLVEGHQIAGGGIILEAGEVQSIGLVKDKDTCLFPTSGSVTKGDRMQRNGHRPWQAGTVLVLSGKYWNM